MNLPDFEYLKQDGQGANTARIGISYSLHPDYESREVLDTGVVLLRDSVNYKTEKKTVEQMDDKIGQVMAGRGQPVPGHILHMRDPGQRMPIGGVKMGERPH